ncbi:Uncharacterised protein [Mycolicibacterium vanbaalenii]|uniref:Lipoprotein n=1 Tax=Mycolicibacterium vanbaalenii TaxID=110539 RepID=A0A5S9Q1P0_MYCVN|nr:hypothetical protein [Mycolicibacterium vanbaalenii]CAA0111071.1 Uncharacterised protein [Mycolicibacterium vanbaalenii]
MVGPKRLFAAALLFTAVSACAHEPPPYESRYTPPAPVAPPPPPLAPGASFVDDFERPNTDGGLGVRWEMRRGEPANPALPVETGAFIRDGHFVSSDDTNVYAVQTLRGTVRRIGAEGRWTKVRNGGYETLVMGIAADDSLGRNLVQLTVSPASWRLSKHRDGDTPAQVAKGTFNPPLALNGTYRFEMDVADGSVTVRVPGVEKEVRVGTLGLLSENAFWQHVSTPKELPIGEKFCIDMVWAAEQGQPLTAIPAPAE